MSKFKTAECKGLEVWARKTEIDCFETKINGSQEDQLNDRDLVRKDKEC